jgi:hypothetical protein
MPYVISTRRWSRTRRRYLPSVAAAAGTFTGSGSFTFGNLETSATGTFLAPVYSGAAAQTFGNLETSATGTFTAPVYSGTAAQTFGNLETSASGTFTEAPDQSLLTDLVSYWKLDEASGNALDAHGSNELTETSGTIASTTGIINGARDIEAADTEYFNLADNATISAGDIDLTWQVWVNLESKSGDMFIVNKWGTSNFEYRIYYDSSSDRFVFGVSTNGTNEVTVPADNLGAPSLSTTYHILAWHDATANTLNIRVNNGTVDSTSHSGGIRDGSSPLRFSHSFDWLDGWIDEIGLWKRVLTSEEQDALWNSGSGLSYDQFAGADHTGTAAVTFGGIETSATGTFVAPVYSGSAAQTFGGLQTTATATFVAPVYSGAAAQTFGGLETSATAIFASQVFSGAGAFAFGGLETTATGTVAAAVFSATASQTFGNLETTATGTFVEPVYTGTATLTFGGLETSGTATSAAVYFGTAAVTFGGVETSGTALFGSSVITGQAPLAWHGFTLTGVGEFIFVAPPLVHHVHLHGGPAVRLHGHVKKVTQSR